MYGNVRFTTNIDFCKRFMGNISGLPLSLINPVLGDRVQVYKDTRSEIWLKVVRRNWTMTNGHTPVLECELHLEDGRTIPEMEKIWRNY